MIQRWTLRLAAICLLLFALEGVTFAKPRAMPDYSTRKIHLKATRNARDLVGIPIEGGSFPKGLLYRTGALCFLTADDVDKVLGLEVTTMIDLRQPSEIKKDGRDRERLRESIKHFYYWPMGNSQGIHQEAYYYLIRENNLIIKRFFHTLADSTKYPVMFHCSAGKDRTGILTALLLESLGTPREFIMEDYLQSQKNASGLLVKPEWLGEVFLYVDAYGGIEPFLEQAGVSSAVLKRVRENLQPTL